MPVALHCRTIVFGGVRPKLRCALLRWQPLSDVRGSVRLLGFAEPRTSESGCWRLQDTSHSASRTTRCSRTAFAVWFQGAMPNDRRRFLNGMITAAGLAAAPPASASAQTGGSSGSPILPAYARAQNYKSLKQSSFDRTGGNRDSWHIPAGGALDVSGPKARASSRTSGSPSPRRATMHLKELVLRAYWDGNAKPSIETPIGDFFGLNLGSYFNYQSEYLACSPGKSLNCYFAMPYRRSARLNVTNEGKRDRSARSTPTSITWPCRKPARRRPVLPRPVPPGRALRASHRRRRQAQPRRPATTTSTCETRGRGHLMGVTLGVLQNAPGWWGEGDDMIFVDDESKPADQRHRLGGLLPGKLGFRRARRRAAVSLTPCTARR